MIQPNEIEWIANTFLKQVKDGETRSKIMRVATVLSMEDDDPEDAYWHLIGFYMDPDNQDDLDELYDSISVAEVFDSIIMDSKD